MLPCWFHLKIRLHAAASIICNLPSTPHDRLATYPQKLEWGSLYSCFQLHTFCLLLVWSLLVELANLYSKLWWAWGTIYNTNIAKQEEYDVRVMMTICTQVTLQEEYTSCPTSYSNGSMHELYHSLISKSRLASHNVILTLPDSFSFVENFVHHVLFH